MNTKFLEKVTATLVLVYYTNLSYVHGRNSLKKSQNSSFGSNLVIFAEKVFPKKIALSQAQTHMKKLMGYFLERREDERTEEQTEGPKFIEHFQPWA